MYEKIEVVLNEKSNTFFDIVKSILVPITIAISTYLYTTSVNQNNVNQKYIEIAINILKDPPSQKNEDLRKWAIKIINKYSEIKLDKKLKQSLIKNIQISNSYDDIFLKSNKYHFKWPYDPDVKGYEFEIQQKLDENSSWQFYDGKSIKGNIDNIINDIPNNSKHIRWRITPGKSKRKNKWIQIK